MFLSAFFNRFINGYQEKIIEKLILNIQSNTTFQKIILI